MKKKKKDNFVEKTLQDIKSNTKIVHDKATNKALNDVNERLYLAERGL